MERDCAGDGVARRPSKRKHPPALRRMGVGFPLISSPHHLFQGPRLGSRARSTRSPFKSQITAKKRPFPSATGALKESWCLPIPIAIAVPMKKPGPIVGFPALNTVSIVRSGRVPLSDRESLSRFLEFSRIDDEHLQAVLNVGKARIGIVVQREHLDVRVPLLHGLGEASA
ncbi:MAG: hypothetical protein RL318_671 [Fibrobacterota bacterium]